MMEEFKKLLVSKAKSQEGKPKDESKLRAKASMAKELSDMLGSDLTDDIKGGLKKVTVASDSEEGLKSGLKKAEDVLEESDSESEDESEDSSSEDSEGEGMGMHNKYRHGQHEASEGESADEIEMKIEDLKRQLEDLKSKR
jgi:hypothetical protein